MSEVIRDLYVLIHIITRPNKGRAIIKIHGRQLMKFAFNFKEIVILESYYGSYEVTSLFN